MLQKILTGVAAAVAPVIAKAVAEKLVEVLPELADIIVTRLADKMPEVAAAVADRILAHLPDLSALDDEAIKALRTLPGLGEHIVQALLDRLPHWPLKF
ncbi:hypothetical protein PBI_ZOEJ_90 [Mycobacterium phage ZoeJ]|uniref:Uncharacterized protein n=1 Tax=Mycobacterium phage ZoeJ TaxID=1486427 RepID=A0A023W6G3_9CAUD|nr:hypothetical protein PBI_ZOEJ_90 [Mycobacterium phage ZoeJ]AHY26914.1 hypothetical protein PBI_ZOEJ_90 [Mycobacterium phage ZoeJ]